MVNYYSFKISREDAKNKPLEKEEIINEKGFKKKFNDFIEAWENIKEEIEKNSEKKILKQNISQPEIISEFQKKECKN